MTGTSYGNEAGFNCSDGYQLYGPQKIHCKIDGQWSGDAPICKRICKSENVVHFKRHLLEPISLLNIHLFLPCGAMARFARKLLCFIHD